MLSIYVIIELFYGLYWKQNTHFFFLKLISTEKSYLFEKFTATNNYQSANFVYNCGAVCGNAADL